MNLRVLSLGILLAGCASKQPATVDAPAPVDASTQPALTVVASPTTVAPGATVTVAVTTTSFKVIDPRTGPTPKTGEGHFHYYLDDAVDYVAGWTPTISIKTTAATTPGVHRVRFVLATSAHVEVTPLVEATTSFTVQ